MMKNKTAQQMVSELLDHGIKQPQLAGMVDATQSQISRISKGQEPGYSLGKRIEAVYSDRLGKKAA